MFSLLDTSFKAVSPDVKLLVFSLWFVLLEISELTATLIWESKKSAITIWLTLLESSFMHSSQSTLFSSEFLIVGLIINNSTISSQMLLDIVPFQLGLGSSFLSRNVIVLMECLNHSWIINSLNEHPNISVDVGSIFDILKYVETTSI